MPTIKEYFIKDLNGTITGSQEIPVTEKHRITGKENSSTFTARLHMDHTANALYISYFIPACSITDRNVCDFILNPQPALALRRVQVDSGFFFEKPITSMNMHFTNMIYVYSEKSFGREALEYIQEKADKQGLIIRIMDEDYAKERTKLDIPRAFISHDSRDKDSIARPLAERLTKRFCTVWYDEYSLRIGDNLRESIEKGIKECKKCILILSPNFTSNNGWSKNEFESIFQRNLMEPKNIILPIWHNISKQKIYEYCSSLTNIYALDSSRPGIKDRVVCRHLI